MEVSGVIMEEIFIAYILIDQWWLIRNQILESLKFNKVASHEMSGCSDYGSDIAYISMSTFHRRKTWQTHSGEWDWLKENKNSG